MWAPTAILLLLGGGTLVDAQPGGIGKSTYSMSHPFAWKDFMEANFPTAENMVQENNTQRCVEWVKLCIDDGYMTQCNGPQGNMQMHSVGAYKRYSGPKSMEQLEGEFTKAFGAMDQFDPFFDNVFAYFTGDVDNYIDLFESSGVPHFVGTFSDPSTGTQYVSVIVQIPGSLDKDAKSIVAVELIGEGSAPSGAHEYELPRASPEGLSTATTYLANALRGVAANGRPVIAPLHISMATSDLATNVAWFETAMFGTEVYRASGASGTMYYGQIYPGDPVEVRYFQSTAATQGPVSVAAWEKYQADLHSGCFDSANNEGFDRLADNHYGSKLGQYNLKPYENGQIDAGLPYRYYAQKFLYVYGPNGWGIQLIGQCNGCDYDGYDMCTQGITGHCSVDGNSAGDLVSV